LTDTTEETDLATHQVDGNSPQSIPVYKLRATTTTTTDTANTNKYECWVRPPLYFDEEAVRELTGEQIESTLDYFSMFRF
jgi:hypothetical protein